MNSESSNPTPEDISHSEDVVDETSSAAIDPSQIMDPRDLVYTSRIEGRIEEVLTNQAVVPQSYLSEAADQRSDFYRSLNESNEDDR